MKTITINVSDPVYRDFVSYSKRVDRPTSELIRAAMEDYHQRTIARRTSLRDRRPISAGGEVSPLSREDDLLEEMLDDDRL